MDSLDLENATGLIVDFRLNSGGHDYPMLLNLAKIINPAVLFNYTNEKQISLSTDGNTLISSNTEDTNITLYQVDYLPAVKYVNLPVAILVDEATYSSGAITAFALKENSRQNQVLGERTSSTLSVNASLELNDGNYFNLMILRLISSGGIQQPLYLDVDAQVNHDFSAIFDAKDQSIKRAIELLRSNNKTI